MFFRRKAPISGVVLVFGLFFLSQILAGSIQTAHSQSVRSRDVHVNGQQVACLDGEAAGYRCNEIDLLSILRPEEIRRFFSSR